MGVADLLAERRPHRADARRNFDALLAAARSAFTELGTDASLEEIARRAGVGIGTLYRNFPTREDLIESVYVAEVDALCRFGDEQADADPWEALVAWLRQFMIYMGTKQALLDGLNRDSSAFRACRDALYESGEPLLARAQEAGAARGDTDIDAVMRFIIGVTAVEFTGEDQRELIFTMALAGIHT
ncbi:TetR/AcrR family transcriptional regulator [Actinomadura scrupuli]|uniref:TetR/AcrR family transcriptional regulator n=1 Tax=Actinomadura scrupuli TaxID=559629 RepID=UPI003D994589